jgi:CCR4-NOT transcriptional regulation complex NOT5 subunit
MLDPMP